MAWRPYLSAFEGLVLRLLARNLECSEDEVLRRGLRIMWYLRRRGRLSLLRREKFFRVSRESVKKYRRRKK